MCEAYKAKMTQSQSYVWFLPGWFNKNWYDIDSLKKVKIKNQSTHFVKTNLTIGSIRETVDMFHESKVSELPSCSTREMLLALDGHFSLDHANFGSDESVIQGNRTVSKWKQDVKKRLNKLRLEYLKERMMNHNGKNSFPESDLENPIELNKHSGYVYDAVWLYAYALDTLISSQSNRSYIQNLHSERTVKEFVSIIENTSFAGVSGRINFNGRPSRLSNVRILQWLKNTSDEIFDQEIGIYVPEYGSTKTKTNTHKQGEMESWDERIIQWRTLDGSKPLDDPKECGILSTFATKLRIECQLAITIIFMIGFGILLSIIFIVFLVFKRR